MAIKVTNYRLVTLRQKWRCFAHHLLLCVVARYEARVL
jgi:hypothetical protein